jgi:DNA-binding beta-propeller fold protein YncE
VTTLAGFPGLAGSADGAGAMARFDTPRGIAALPDGTLYVTDAGNHTIRRIAPDGTVTTIAGVAGVAGSDDGPALQAHLNTPSGIDVNDKGEVFIVDTFSHTIRMLKDGMLTTIAGTPGVSGFADGDAATAKFNAPVGLKIAPDGSLVVADTGNNVIRRLTLR